MRVVTVANPAGEPRTSGMANVPRVSTNTSMAAVARAGRISGRVIVRSTVMAPAPAARAARSSAGSARAARPTAATT